MDFIVAAETQSSGGGFGGLLTLMLPLLLFMIVFMWWSNRKRSKEAETLDNSLEVGRDAVLRNGSVVTIREIDSEYVTVERSPGNIERWVPGAIARVLPVPGSEEVLAEDDSENDGPPPGIIDGDSK